MKKYFLIGTVIVLTTALNSGAALAAPLNEDAYREAADTIIAQRPVDEAAIRQRGSAYAAAFLEAFRSAGNDYQAAFCQGSQDGLVGRAKAQGKSELEQAGYDRGYTHGCRLRGNSSSQKATEQSDLPTPLEEGNPPVAGMRADDGTYPIRKPDNSQAAFIIRLAQDAQRIGAKYDLYPSVIIAQAALESNWGASSLSNAPYHNLFGVKGYFMGKTISSPTEEYDQQGHRFQINDHFRWYESDYQALEDYAQTLDNSLYQDVHRSRAKTYREATHALMGKYATDPAYEQKLNELIDSYQLTRYDFLPERGQTEQVSARVPVEVKEGRTPEIKAPAAKKKAQHHHSVLVPLLGGAGSAGLWGLVRRIEILK